jgi:hypothetical protein
MARPAGRAWAVLPDEQPPPHHLRKKGTLIVTATIEAFRDLRKQAAELCTECLRDHIADNAAVLGDLSDIAENMAAIRETSFENEELYQTATAELIAAIMIIAVFTAELANRPIPVASFTVSAN